jgi:hypothetical protein
VQPDRGAIEVQLLRDGDEAFELPGVECRRSDDYRSLSRVMRLCPAPVPAIVRIEYGLMSQHGNVFGYHGHPGGAMPTDVAPVAPR